MIMLRRKFFQSSLFFCSFPLIDCSIFSILQFLGNLLQSILDEDGIPSPIRYEKRLSLADKCILSR